jgi:hypothetical protein
MSLYKLSKGRCWANYEPVPGKEAYSDGSCRPVGSKKKDKKKQEKSAGKRGLWDNVHAKRKRGEKPAKPGDKDFPDAKGWNKAVKSSSLMDKLNLIKFNYTQPKQASLEDLNTERFVKLLDLK